MSLPKPFERRGPIDEPHRPPEPRGPFVERKGIKAPSANDRWRLEMLAGATHEALYYAKSAAATFEWCRPWTQGANSAALAVAALERLIVELTAVQENYGVDLVNERQRREE